MSEAGDAPEGGSGHIFISYARTDRARVAPIVTALESRGRRVWWDSHLAGGSTYAREIETALRAADAVIVVWSQASVHSDWVRDEATVGLELSRLVPIRLDDTTSPLGFGQIHTIDLARWNGHADAPEIAQLIHAIDRTGAGEVHRIARPARSSGSPLARRALLIGAAAAPILALGAWWLAGRPWSGGGASAPAHSIAVLPFANLSGDAAQDYFADGLTEELIGALARLPSLQVAGRTSSFKFKGSKDDGAAIAAQLGVAYLLEGSVRRQGDQARISAELVDARSGFTRWSQDYDHDLKDVLATQASIAEAVAEQLKGALLGGEIAAISAGGTANPTAYDAYLQGKRVFDLGGGEDAFRAALAQFDAAVAADPGFAAAHSARARVLLTLGDEFSGPAAHNDMYAQALAAAKRAVALAPGLAEAQATLADTLASAFLDFAGARAAYALAIATGAGQSEVLTRYGLFNCDIGEFAAGLAAANRATILDPLNPRVFASLGSSSYVARKYPEAIAAMRRALVFSPGLNAAHERIGFALLQQGDAKAAAGEFALEPVGWLKQTGLAIALHRLGDAAGAEAAYRALTSDPDDIVYYQQAMVLAQWGKLDGAFAALDSAISGHDGGVVAIKADPSLDPLRADPRFAVVLRRLGLAS
jgi:TolB-like protein/tetratricopeptide (TPR) repeat protein